MATPLGASKTIAPSLPGLNERIAYHQPHDIDVTKFNNILNPEYENTGFRSSNYDVANTSHPYIPEEYAPDQFFQLLNPQALPESIHEEPFTEYRYPFFHDDEHTAGESNECSSETLASPDLVPVLSQNPFQARQVQQLTTLIGSLLAAERQQILYIVENAEPDKVCRSSEQWTCELATLSPDTLDRIEMFVSSLKPCVQPPSFSPLAHNVPAFFPELPTNPLAFSNSMHIDTPVRGRKRKCMEDEPPVRRVPSPKAEDDLSSNYSDDSNDNYSYDSASSGSTHFNQSEESGTGKFKLTVCVYDIRDAKAEDGSYACPKCDRTFTDSSNLMKHVRVHTSEKPYQCPKCTKSFTHSSTLKDHMNIHTKSKPYVCSHPGCGKSFPNGSNLNRHMRIHTGSKPYKCSICKKSFSQSSNLKVHAKIHERETR